MAIPDRTALLTLMRVENANAKDIRRILERSASQLGRDIAKLPGDSISAIQAKAQKAAIAAQLNQDFSNINKAIADGRVAAAQAASKVMSMYENELLQLVLDEQSMKNLAASEAKRAVNGLNAAMQRMGGTTYTPLSQQVYKTKQLASGWVDDIVNQALVSGWSAARLAREVRSSISPDVPGGVSYAANRLARSEINNAFHAASVQRYEDSGLVEEVDWHLSTSHPEGDVCDDLAHNSPYKVKNVPRKPHPNCYCYITPHLPDEEEFLNNLLAGKYGDEPWAGSVSPSKIDSSYQISDDDLLKMSNADIVKEQKIHAARANEFQSNWAKAHGISKDMDYAQYQKMWADPAYDSINSYRIKLRDIGNAKQLAAKGAPKAARVAKKAAVKAPVKSELQTPLPMTRRTWNAQGDQGLQVKYNKGIRVDRILSEDSANGIVTKIRFSDGTAGVIKQSENARDMTNEILAQQAYEKLGVNVPKAAKVFYQHEQYNIFDYVDADSPWDAATRLGYNNVDDMLKGMVGKNTGLEEMVRADYIIGNVDRHMGNWMVDKDGKVIGIDHGLTLDPTTSMDVQDTSLVFFGTNVDRVKELSVGWNRAAVEAQLREIKPMFDQLNRTEDWDAMMDRVGLLDEAFREGTLGGLR